MGKLGGLGIFTLGKTKSKEGGGNQGVEGLLNGKY